MFALSVYSQDELNNTHTERERRPDLFRTLDSFLFSFPGESLQHEQRWKAIAPAGGVGVN